MNDKKQLDCELQCKATACCQSSIAEDMEKEDASLLDLIKENDNDNETQDISDTSG